MSFSSTPIPPARDGPDDPPPRSEPALPPFDGTLPYFPHGGAIRRSCCGAALSAPAVSGGAPKMVLFVWELGGGLGHLMQMLPLARDLVRRGHRVAVALRHLSQSAADVFGRCGVSFLQAPFRSTGALAFPRPANFAHLLANVGFARDGELFLLANSWRNLMRLVKPDPDRRRSQSDGITRRPWTPGAPGADRLGVLLPA